MFSASADSLPFAYGISNDHFKSIYTVQKFNSCKDLRVQVILLLESTNTIQFKSSNKYMSILIVTIFTPSVSQLAKFFLDTLNVLGIMVIRPVYFS